MRVRKKDTNRPWRLYVNENQNSMYKLMIVVFVLVSSCMAKPKPEAKKVPPKDTIRTTVLFAINVKEFQTKILIRDTLVDALEPADKDSMTWNKVKKKVYDTMVFIRVIDTAVNKGVKRPIDTFYQVNPRYVIQDLNKKW